MSLLSQETLCLHIKAWWPKGAKARDGKKGQRGMSVIAMPLNSSLQLSWVKMEIEPEGRNNREPSSCMW